MCDGLDAAAADGWRRSHHDSSGGDLHRRRPECRTGRDGKPQPTIHTHSEGNCQPSVWDITTITVRNAPFDGIQCGTKQVAWFTASQFQAMAKANPAY